MYTKTVTVRTRQYRIYGLENVTKTAEDGYIKFLGNHRFVVDFTILIRDLKIQLDCQLKIGHRWQKKRISLRNKLYEMYLTKCRLYVELVIDSDEKSIRFERLSPISQEYGHHHNNHRPSSQCKSSLSSLSSSCHFPSFNHLFSTVIERYFKNYIAVNLSHLEMVANRKLSNDGRKQSTNHRKNDYFTLDYNNLIIQTSLYKILNVFLCQQYNNNDDDDDERKTRLGHKKQITSK